MQKLLLIQLAAASTCTALEQVNPQAATPGHIIVRQDTAAAATLTLGPRDNYLQTPTATANPTGTQLRILPTEFVDNTVPEGGLDFFFGEDLTSSLTSSLENCGDDTAEECVSSLVAILNQGRAAELQTRIIGIDDALLIGGAVLVAVIGILIENARMKGQPPSMPVPSHVHLPSTDVVQLQSQTGSVIPIVTSSNAEVITIPATLPTSVEGPTTASIFTLTTDVGSHTSGVSVCAVPTQPANLADQLLGMSGYCDHKTAARRRDAIDYNAVGRAATFLIPYAAPGQLLNAFGLVATSRLPQLRDEASRISWNAVSVVARLTPGFEDVPATLRDSITSASWQAAYQWCVEGLNEAVENLYFEESLWGEGENTGDDGGDEDDPECPADAPRGINALSCDDAYCQGDENNRCKVPAVRKCECLPTLEYDPYGGTEEEWQAGQYVLESLQAEGGAACDTKLVNVEKKDFASLAGVFCDDPIEPVDLASDASKDLAGFDILSSAYGNLNFHFEWKVKEGGCSATCGEIFQGFAEDGRCSFASHAVAASGHQDLVCGEASFNITEKEPDEGFPPDNTPIGEQCDHADEWGCTADHTQLVTCSCPDGSDICTWTSYAKCPGQKCRFNPAYGETYDGFSC